jgi:uncharacterized protein YecT (DUF1311 family)
MNTKRWLYLIVCLASFSATTSHECIAESCYDHASDQAAMNKCASQDLRSADSNLNSIYKALMAKISPVGQIKLKELERLWIKYRDQQCDFNANGTSGGSVHSMTYAMCLTELAIQQAKLLKSQLECEEGDVSCSGQ